MNDARPLLSVVVPCRNESDCIEACLASILCQEEPTGGFEVIVADGMSDDGTREILSRVAQDNARVRVIDNPRLSVSSGLNAAIGIARGDVIVRMDAHTKYAADYVRTCLTVLQDTGADNVGGPWVATGSGVIGSAIAAAFRSSLGVGMNRVRDPSYEGTTDTVYLGCWRRELFESVGLFDEELLRNQDDEFNLRLTLAGGRIWQSPRIRSWYQPRQDLVSLCRQYAQYGYWKVRVVQKHRRLASFRHIIPGLFVLFLGVFGLASVWSSLAKAAFMAGIVAYSVVLLMASVLATVGSGWKVVPVLPLVYACYHLSYGYGSLRGFMDVIARRDSPAHAYTRLTRASASLRHGTRRQCVTGDPSELPRDAVPTDE